MSTILIVEDSRLIRSMVVQAFDSIPEITVMEAASMAEAVRIVEDEQVPIFAALLDLVLPDAVQGEIVSWVGRHNIPAVVFTSEINEEIRRSLIRAGVVDYIVKRDSLAIKQVVEVVRQLLRNRGFSVLAVDDSRSMRRYFDRMLNNYCFSVHIASSGEEALAVMEAHPEIRLIITDYTMPGIDGFELVRRLRKTRQPGELAIIGTAGRDNAMIATRFLKEGANDFLPKPFWAEEFYQRISQNIEQIDRLDRLKALNATKNRFLGMAAHDLRSPLGGIINGIELIGAGYLGEISTEAQELLAEMGESASGMYRLVDELLDVSAIEAGSILLTMESVDLGEIIEGQLRIQRPGADRKGVTLLFERSGPSIITTDRRAVSQIAANIISNAIKYTKPNTTVSVVLEEGDAAPGFSVTDQGHGIPEAERKRLFGAFSRLSTRPTGGESSHGLGLAIVHRLVSLLGGTITLSGVEGAGSSFTVLLPSGDPLEK